MLIDIILRCILTLWRCITNILFWRLVFHYVWTYVMVLWCYTYAVICGYCTRTRTRTCTRNYCTRNIPLSYDEKQQTTQYLGTVLRLPVMSSRGRPGAIYNTANDINCHLQPPSPLSPTSFNYLFHLGVCRNHWKFRTGSSLRLHYLWHRMQVLRDLAD